LGIPFTPGVIAKASYGQNGERDAAPFTGEKGETSMGEGKKEVGKTKKRNRRGLRDRIAGVLTRSFEGGSIEETVRKKGEKT